MIIKFTSPLSFLLCSLQQFIVGRGTQYTIFLSLEQVGNIFILCNHGAVSQQALVTSDIFSLVFIVLQLCPLLCYFFLNEKNTSHYSLKFI